MLNKKPYIFLITLVAILFFIIGFRYGQNVEKANKIIDYLLSLTPTPYQKSPTPIPTTEYKSKRWGLKLKYPENLKIIESTNSSEIIIEKK